MFWNKFHNWRIIKLGAINGILFGTLLELTLRARYSYGMYVFNQTPLPPDMHIQIAPYPFKWWYLPLLSLVLVTLASFLVNRYLAKYLKSSIWLWQVIGFVAVLEACVYSAITIWYQWYYSRFDFLGMDYLLHAIKSEQSICLRVLPVVLAFNLIFALMLRFRKARLP